MEKERREVASLTKIMTCYLSLCLIKKFNIDETKTFVTVSDNASDAIGTSADLYPGDKLTVNDLLYGLMLPSGNDAAIQLAEFFGDLLLKEKKKEENKEGKRNIYVSRNS
jgi:D-alanyl-D-alanine carboxypeptidase (penicillin-binding protein 5/6)